MTPETASTACFSTIWEAQALRMSSVSMSTWPSRGAEVTLASVILPSSTVMPTSMVLKSVVFSTWNSPSAGVAASFAGASASGSGSGSGSGVAAGSGVGSPAWVKMSAAASLTESAEYFSEAEEITSFS